MTPGERALLESPSVRSCCCASATASTALLPGVAPGLAWLGRDAAVHAAAVPAVPRERRAGPRERPGSAIRRNSSLVMTSANPGGEPLVTGNDEALARLAGIADAFLVHDRDIVVRCDDSVVRAAPVAPQFVRRARGYTPRAIRLARRGTVGRRARRPLQEHRLRDARRRGVRLAAHRRSRQRADLRRAGAGGRASRRDPRRRAGRSSRTTCIRISSARGTRRGSPRAGACHCTASSTTMRTSRRSSPSTASTRRCWGSRSTASASAPTATAWGGELLYVDGARCERLGRLAPLRLPGGDRAAREPWRMAAAALARAGRGDEIARRFADEPAATPVAAMLARGFNAPETSSMGRWFDAAAGLLGVQATHGVRRPGGDAARRPRRAPRAGGRGPRALRDHGGQRARPDAADRCAWRTERDAAFGAALFHATLVAALADWVTRAAEALDLTTVAGGGGCFLNAILARGLAPRRSACGTSRCSRRRRFRRTTAASRSARRGSRCRPSNGRRLTMCLAIPARVVALPAPDVAPHRPRRRAQGDLAGARRRRARRRLRDRPRRLRADEARSGRSGAHAGDVRRGGPPRRRGRRATARRSRE